MSCNNLFDENEKEDLEKEDQDEAEPTKVYRMAQQEKKTAQKRRRQMMEKIRVTKNLLS
jgi:hypothetical protein